MNYSLHSLVISSAPGTYVPDLVLHTVEQDLPRGRPARDDVARGVEANAPDLGLVALQLARTHPLVHVEDLGDLCAESEQTLHGSFSAVSKPNFARKYAFERSRRDLHNALL